MQKKTGRLSFLFNASSVLIILSLFKLLLHLFVNANGGYGYFRDELYYIACSDHLAWGYVDQPPFSIFMLKISRIFLGDSLLAIRVFPAALGALTVFITGKISKELGGKIFAQSAAAVSVIIAPIYLGMNNYYSMNSFDIFFWTSGGYVLVLILKGGNKNLWYLLGLIIGLGLMNKISMLWFGGGLFAGLILTKSRKLLLTKEPWIAFLIAAVIFLPHIIWQITNDFPTLEFMRNAVQDKYVLQSPLSFLFLVIFVMNPITLPLWLCGLFFYFFAGSGKQYQLLGILFLSVLIILLLNPASKAEYLAPAFTILFASGSVAAEEFFERKKIFWPKPAIIFLLVISIWTAPLAMPILPVTSYIKYCRFIGIKPSSTEKKELSQLPQYFADMFGWKEMTAAVANVYNKLTPDEKEKCIIYCRNYGEASAINFFGKKYGLAPAVSGHNNFYLWGPVRKDADIVIALGDTKEGLGETFKEVIASDTIHTRYSMPYENNLPTWICKHFKIPLAEAWAKTKNYN